jgi:hypothetical protein
MFTTLIQLWNSERKDIPETFMGTEICRVFKLPTHQCACWEGVEGGLNGGDGEDLTDWLFAWFMDWDRQAKEDFISCDGCGEELGDRPGCMDRDGHHLFCSRECRDGF